MLQSRPHCIAHPDPQHDATDAADEYDGKVRCFEDCLVPADHAVPRRTELGLIRQSQCPRQGQENHTVEEGQGKRLNLPDRLAPEISGHAEGDLIVADRHDPLRKRCDSDDDPDPSYDRHDAFEADGSGPDHLVDRLSAEDGNDQGDGHAHCSADEADHDKGRVGSCEEEDPSEDFSVLVFLFRFLLFHVFIPLPQTRKLYLF